MTRITLACADVLLCEPITLSNNISSGGNGADSHQNPQQQQQQQQREKRRGITNGGGGSGSGGATAAAGAESVGGGELMIPGSRMGDELCEHLMQVLLETWLKSETTSVEMWGKLSVCIFIRIFV